MTIPVDLVSRMRDAEALFRALLGPDHSPRAKHAVIEIRSAVVRELVAFVVAEEQT